MLTIALFALFILEQYQYLKRPRLRYIAGAFAVLHIALLYQLRTDFPFSNTLVILFLLVIEGLAVLLLYTRLGQEIDPHGPFGLTETERRERTAHRSWW
jgi:hypothetical protein